MKTLLAAGFLGLALPHLSPAQEWSQPVRGSWVQTGDQPQPNDVVLARNGGGCEIVVAASEHSAVKQAAKFLAGDIEKISGFKPAIVERPSGGRVVVVLTTVTGRDTLPSVIAQQKLVGQWEAYQVLTAPGEVWLVAAQPSPPTH